jgi:transposase-like protein
MAEMSAVRAEDQDATLEELAAEMLVGGAKVSDVAEAVGPDERTIRRWRKRPAIEQRCTGASRKSAGVSAALRRRALIGLNRAYSTTPRPQRPR